MSNSTRTWYFLTVLSLSFILGGQIIAGRPGLLWGFAIALTLNTLVYFYSDLKLDHLFKGRIIDGQDPWGLLEITRRLSEKARVQIPQVYVLNNKGYQAFATGRSNSNKKIFLTEGLLNNFNHDELEAVIAYLMATIKNQDTLPFGVASLLSGFILSTTLFIDRKISWLVSSNWSKNVSLAQGGPFTWIFSPLANLIIRISVNPENYYKSDSVAASWLKNPKSYAQALWKLESYTQTKPIRVPLDTAHMFIVNPLTRKAKSRYFHVQPSTENRIKRLIGHFPI